MQITTARAVEPDARVLVPANTSTDPVQAILEGYGGDDRAAISALLDLVYRQHDEIERLRESLTIANANTAYGYPRGFRPAVDNS